MDHGIYGRLIHHRITHDIAVDVKVMGKEYPEFALLLSEVADHDLSQEEVMGAVNGIIGLDPDLQGGIAGNAARDKCLGHISGFYLPAISQPAEATVSPYPHLKHVS